MQTTHLLYLHGFRSSPSSVKAQKMAAAVKALHPAVCWSCPQLPPSPLAAMAMIDQTVQGWRADPAFKKMAVVGSSLGGFYAAWVAEKYACRAVLLNPAIDPARDLSRHIGEQTVWHDPEQAFFFKPEFIGELRSLEVPVSHPDNYFVVMAKGDEVLDWREMNSRYSQARVKLLEGGDHALSDFDDHMADILAFLDLA